MIDHENLVFDAVVEALRTTFEDIFITGVELVSTPPHFPAVSIVLTDSQINERHSTFDKVDNVAVEEYKVEVVSNLESQKAAKEQTKAIMAVIDGVMSGLFYPRSFCQPIPSADATIARRVARYKKNNVTMEV